MDAFRKKSLKTNQGHAYTYYVIDGDELLPALLFHHGWPDHAAIWKDVVTGLASTTRRSVIVPDMLGYDGTDKPTDPIEYRWDKLTKDMTEILDAEGKPQVISIGHDWGSTAASWLYNYHPDRVLGLINMNVPYTPPDRSAFDLDNINAVTQQAFGTPLLSYWEVLAAPDGPRLLYDNIERLFNLMYSKGDIGMLMFTTTGAFRSYLVNDEPVGSGLRPFAEDASFKATFVDRMTRDGFEGPQCWYVATKDNIHLATDTQLPKESDVVNVPTLYLVVLGIPCVEQS